ncbi:MAG: hypothetical protein ACRC9W_01900, partial [Plesiomonas sp.]
RAAGCVAGLAGLAGQSRLRGRLLYAAMRGVELVMLQIVWCDERKNEQRRRIFLCAGVVIAFICFSGSAASAHVGIGAN